MSFPVNGELLDFCVLAVVEKGDAYGYRLTQELNDVIHLSESTLYPVLRRLKKKAWLETYDAAFEGRNRRYYRITPKGIKKLTEYRKMWDDYISKMQKIVKEGKDDRSRI